MEKAEIIRYIEELRENGMVRHIGLSSHTLEPVNKVLGMKTPDMLMFSMNPFFILTAEKEKAFMPVTVMLSARNSDIIIGIRLLEAGIT